MGYFLSAVIGFNVVLLVGLFMLLKYLMMGLDSKSSVIIDPMPAEKKYN